jgi:hypothetical protein
MLWARDWLADPAHDRLVSAAAELSVARTTADAVRRHLTVDRKQ